MSLSAAGKNVMLNALGAVAVFVAAHNVDAPTDGTTEIAGGSPAYARKAITWGAAAAGSMAASNSPVFDIPAGAVVKSIALWSASTAGTFYGAADVTDETYGGQGTYTVSSYTISVT